MSGGCESLLFKLLQDKRNVNLATQSPTTATDRSAMDVEPLTQKIASPEGNPGDNEEGHDASEDR